MRRTRPTWSALSTAFVISLAGAACAAGPPSSSVSQSNDAATGASTPSAPDPEQFREAVRDASTVTAEERAERERYGWSNDVSVLGEAQQDTLARDRAGVPHPPFPMTDREFAQYDSTLAAVMRADPIIDKVLESFADDVTTIAVDMTQPGLGLVVTHKRGRDPGRAIESLKRQLGDVTISVRQASLSAADVATMWGQLASDGAFEGEFDGTTVKGILFIETSNELRVTVDGGDWERLGGRQPAFESDLRQFLSVPDDVEFSVDVVTLASGG